MTNKRILSIVLILAVVVCLAVASWIAGSSIKSPAEVAARTAPPAPSPILVPIDYRILSSKIMTRGTARFGLPQPITIVPSLVKNQTAVITRLPRPNQRLDQGDVLLTASGRPLFILVGDVPIYRDLISGTTGKDVRQLQDNLRILGFDPGPAEGDYDDATQQAVAKWYISRGWRPFSATSEQLNHIKSLEQDLIAARVEKENAEDALALAPQVLAAARARAASENQIAMAEVVAKRAERDRLQRIRSRRSDRARAKAELELAEITAATTKLQGEVEVRTALDAQKAASRNVQLTEAKIVFLQAELEVAMQRATVQVPADEIVFVRSLPVRVEDLSAVLGEDAAGTVLSVTDNQVAIDSALPLEEAGLVKAGMPVMIDEAALGIRAQGVVHRVAGTSGTNGVDGYHVYFEVRVNQSAVGLVGFSLRLTIPVESTGGPVLVVPISALSLGADGFSRIQVENQGRLSHLQVQPGLSADGFVEVSPINGELKKGQLVVVGFEQNVPSSLTSAASFPQ